MGNWTFSQSGYNYFGIYKHPTIKNQFLKDTISGNYRNGKNYEFEQAFFVWGGKRSLPYLDLRINENKDKILIYDQSKSHPAVKDYFRKGECIVITSDNADEWYGVERIEVQKDTKKYYNMDYGVQSGTTLLHTTSGWIKKEDLVNNPWIKQTQQTKSFRFEISTDEESVNAVKIINKKTGRKQIILDLWSELKDNPINVIQTGDYNFDGYQDFMFLMQTGGAGPNDTHNFYLYNPNNNNFEYSQELSELPQIQIDTKNKMITSNWRDGAAHHGGEKYTFINQQLTKISYWDQNASTGFFGQESSGELINGKWVDHHYKTAEVLSPAATVYKDKTISKVFSDTVSKGDYALIKDENGLFFYAEITTATNRLIKGWIAKENFLPQNRSVYTTHTPPVLL